MCQGLQVKEKKNEFYVYKISKVTIWQRNSYGRKSDMYLIYGVVTKD